MTTGAAFVSGASGFVGQRLVRRLAATGRQVRALVHRSPLPDVPGVVPVPGDLADVASFVGSLGGVELIVHCGALLDPIADVEAAERINHRATMALARAGRDAGVGRFVFVSSIAAIGFRADAGLLDPRAPCAPTTPYGKSKRDAERGLGEMDAGAMRVVTVRPPTVYGAGEHRNFLALTRAVATGLFPVPGRGDNRMSFCHVDNLIDGLLWAAELGEAPPIVHVADREPVTLRHTVDTISRAVGRHPLRVPFPMPVARAVAVACEAAWAVAGRPPPLSRARLRTITSDCALDTRASAALGFAPSVDFEAGVRDAVEWYRRERLLRATGAT